MDTGQLVEFVRQRGLVVVATRDALGDPQAALVGVAATAEGEIVFDTSALPARTSGTFAYGLAGGATTTTGPSRSPSKSSSFPDL